MATVLLTYIRVHAPRDGMVSAVRLKYWRLSGVIRVVDPYRIGGIWLAIPGDLPMNNLVQLRISVVLAGLVFSLLSAVSHARSTVLVEPEPVTIGCSLPTEKMEEAIKSGGTMRRWTVVGQTPGLTELQFIKGNNKHIINVNVGYTATTFTITYKDSVNLSYAVKDDGTRRIHPRPIGWMNNLSADIQMAANNYCRR